MCKKFTAILRNGYVMYVTNADNIAVSYRIYKPNAKNILDYWMVDWMYTSKGIDDECVAKTIIILEKMNTKIVRIEEGDTRNNVLYHLKKQPQNQRRYVPA